MVLFLFGFLRIGIHIGKFCKIPHEGFYIWDFSARGFYVGSLHDFHIGIHLGNYTITIRQLVIQRLDAGEDLK